MRMLLMGIPGSFTATPPQGVIITTTDPHLARRIGEKLHHAHRGTFTCRYEEKEDLLRANWQP